MAGSSTTPSRNRSNRASSEHISVARLRSYAAWTCPTTPATGTPPFRAARLAAKTSRRSCSSTSSTFSLYARSMRRYRGCSAGPRAARLALFSKATRSRRTRRSSLLFSMRTARSSASRTFRASFAAACSRRRASISSSSRFKISKRRRSSANARSSRSRRSLRQRSSSFFARSSEADTPTRRERASEPKSKSSRDVSRKRRAGGLYSYDVVAAFSSASSTVPNDASRSRYTSRSRLKSSAFAFDDVRPVGDIRSTSRSSTGSTASSRNTRARGGAVNLRAARRRPRRDEARARGVAVQPIVVLAVVVAVVLAVVLVSVVVLVHLPPYSGIIIRLGSFQAEPLETTRDARLVSSTGSALARTTGLGGRARLPRGIHRGYGRGDDIDVVRRGATREVFVVVARQNAALRRKRLRDAKRGSDLNRRVRRTRVLLGALRNRRVGRYLEARVRRRRFGFERLLVVVLAEVVRLGERFEVGDDGRDDARATERDAGSDSCASSDSAASSSSTGCFSASSDSATRRAARAFAATARPTRPRCAA